MTTLVESRSTKILILALLAICLVVAGCKGSGGAIGAVAGGGIGYALGGWKGALIGSLAGLALGTIIEAAIEANSKRAAQTGQPCMYTKDQYRYESYPVRRTADGRNMQVATVVYEKQAPPPSAPPNTPPTYVRAQKDGKPVPVVITEVPAGQTPGLAERPGSTRSAYGDDIQATASATTDNSGRTTYTINKTSPAGHETIVLADTELQQAASGERREH